MNLFAESREAWRTLTRRPRLLIQAMITLALGVAASTVLFSIVVGTLLSPPEVPDPERLLALHRPGSDEAGIGQPDLADIRASLPQYSGVGLIWDGYAFDAVFGDRPVRINGAIVDKGWFDAVGAPPLLGRLFSPAEDVEGAPRVVVLSESLWRTRFGAREDVIGSSLPLNGEAFEIIGVARDATDVLRLGTEIWAPAAIGGDWVYRARGSGVFDAIARLAPGVTQRQADAALAALMQTLAEQHPRSNLGKTLVGTPVQAFVSQSSQRLLWVLQAATLALLLVGAVNVASLMLVRGIVREGEIGMRGALGAGRARLIRVMLFEGAIVGASGALLGAVIAFASLDAVLHFARPALPAHADATIDLRVLGFALGVSVAAGLLAALIPALRAGRFGPTTARVTASPRVRGVLDGLMAVEVALACALAIAALLLLRSLSGLSAVSLGFEPRGVLGAELVLPDSRYGRIDAQSDAVRRTIEALERQPGIEHAAFVVGPPLRPGCCIGHDLVIEGQVYGERDTPSARVRPVLGDYFGTLGIPLGEGRGFLPSDDAGAARVAIVNRRFAQQYFPGESALGKRIAWRPGDVTPIERGPQWMTIVGVAEDVRSGSLRQGDSLAVYFPYLQRDQEWIRFGTLLARTRGESMRLAAAMQEALSGVDPLIPLQDVRSLGARAAEAVAPERFAAWLASGFGLLAVALALQGIVAVLSFGVAQRRAEFGVRAALGADARRLERLMLHQGGRVAVLGILLGIALALLTARGLEQLLYGVTGRDAATYAFVAFALIAVALLAAWWPARQAARIAPGEALRHH